MNRIFLPRTVLTTQPHTLTGELHKQVSVVLRSRPGDRFLAVCGDGNEYLIEIGTITGKETPFTLIGKNPVDREPSLRLTLAIGMLKAAGLEEILPQLVYLGVARVIPLFTGRCQGKPDAFSASRQERIDRILQRATALSGRTRLMQVDSPMSLDAALALARVSNRHHSFFFWEEAEPIPLKTSFYALKPGFELLLLTGPEGGFTREEADEARNAGCTFASLGSRILDAKTAPLAAAAAALYETGDI